MKCYLEDKFYNLFTVDGEHYSIHLQLNMNQKPFETDAAIFCCGLFDRINVVTISFHSGDDDWWWSDQNKNWIAEELKYSPK